MSRVPGQGTEGFERCVDMGNYQSTACVYNEMTAFVPSAGFRVIEGGLSASKRGFARSVKEQLVAGWAIALVLITLTVAWQISDATISRKTQLALSQARCETVVVHPGDTLWGLAQSHGTGSCDTREVVRYIREINGLDSACLEAGMELRVPSL